MPYPKALVDPMRAELTELGVDELRDAEAVETAFDEASEGTMLLVINSVCGCAASNARPAVSLAMNAETQPDRYVTVFAGQDLEATDKAREKLPGIPPSSPFLALFKDGSPVHVIERRNIEGRSASAIATDLKEAFEEFCDAEGPFNGGTQTETDGETYSDASGDEDDELPSTFKSIMN